MSQGVNVRPDENGNWPTFYEQKNAQNVLTIPLGTITATNTNIDLPVGNYTEIALDTNITTVNGTSPSYTLSVNRKGLDGVYYPIYTGTAQTVAGKISISLGVGASTNVSFGSVIQIIETISGTTPSVTRSMSVIGK